MDSYREQQGIQPNCSDGTDAQERNNMIEGGLGVGEGVDAK